MTLKHLVRAAALAGVMTVSWSLSGVWQRTAHAGCTQDQHDEWIDKQNQKHACKADPNSALCNANKTKACGDIKTLAIECNYEKNSAGARKVDGVLGQHFCTMGCAALITGVVSGAC